MVNGSTNLSSLVMCVLIGYQLPIEYLSEMKSSNLLPRFKTNKIMSWLTHAPNRKTSFLKQAIIVKYIRLFILQGPIHAKLMSPVYVN